MEITQINNIFFFLFRDRAVPSMTTACPTSTIAGDPNGTVTTTTLITATTREAAIAVTTVADDPITIPTSKWKKYERKHDVQRSNETAKSSSYTLILRSGPINNYTDDDRILSKRFFIRQILYNVVPHSNIVVFYAQIDSN